MSLTFTGKTTLTGKTTQSPSATDPLISNVTSIVKFQSYPGNTTFQDSITDAVWTGQDQAEISDVESKFGGRSGVTTGTATDEWTTPYVSGPYNLADSDFCVEGWIFPQTSGSTGHLIGQWQTAANFGWNISYNDVSQTYVVEWSTDGNFSAPRSITGTSSLINRDEWTHLAWVRNGATGTMYVNGVADSTTITFSTDVIFNSTSDPHLAGSSGQGDYFLGYMDDWRVTIGDPRYITNFTPPTQSFPVR
jgi:hypothetical protein